MRPARHSSHLATDLGLMLCILLLVVILVVADGRDAPQRLAAEVTLSGRAAPVTVPADFLGISTEYPALTTLVGREPAAPDPVLVALLRDLAPQGGLSLRIGGDTTDWTWWPVAGMARPPGVRYSLGPAWVAGARALARAVGARLLLGLNLEAGSPEVAAVEAEHLLAGLGRSAIDAFELGNEPSLYGTFGWYTRGGHGVPGRPRSYGFSDYMSDFATFAGSLGGLPLAGPAADDTSWTRRIGEFLTADPSVSVVTLHHYPLQHCYIGPRNPHYPSIAHLLAPAASAGLAARFAPAAATVHRAGRRLRIDELNTVACGAVPAVSQSFAAALWTPDALFNLLSIGVDGVNLHTFPHAGYALFDRAAGGGWNVSSEFLGLMLFAQAAPPGSRLMDVGASLPPWIRLWATQAPDGTVRVLAIDDDPSRPARIAVALAGGGGTLLRLQGPSLAALGGATLGGRGFARPTTTGRLDAPQLETVGAAGGRYFFTVGPASAALLTVSPR